MKTLVAIFDLYILLMGFLSLLVTAPLMWNAAPNAYFGVLLVLGVWCTIIAIVVAIIIEIHESSKPQEKHDL
nr:MAG TPA: hypothetical protein [Caudoviricetes sp.]